MVVLTLVVGGQAARIAELTAANTELAAKLAKLEYLQSRNSKNSSMNPSGDDAPGKTPPPVEPKPSGEGRQRGKQPGAPGTHLEFREKPDETKNRFPEGDCCCGADLETATDLGVVDSYQQTDIPEVTVTVTQYDMHKVACGCGRVHTATRPEGARQGRVGYGPNLQAFAVYLLVVQHIPVQRCVALLEALTGAKPSDGFVHAMLARTSASLAEVHRRIRALIAVAYAVCVDETPLRVGPKKPKPGRKKAEKYLIVACTEAYTHYLLGDRDLDTFTASVLADIDGTNTVIVHDRYINYDSTELGVFVHQLCTAHLLRDLAGAGEVYPDAEWPTQIADALRALIHESNLARQAGQDRIDAEVKAALTTLFTDGVLVGLSETTSHGNRPGERKARLVLEVLRDRPHDVLRFAEDLAIPPTSNQAERDLRPSKLQQNISGRLPSVERTQDRYTIRGYVSTAIKHGHKPIEVLRGAVIGKPWMPDKIAA